MDTCLGILVQINTQIRKKTQRCFLYTNFYKKELRTGNNEHIVDYLWTW